MDANIDNDTAQAFIQLIKEIARDEIAYYLSKNNQSFETYVDMKVIKVNSDSTANVQDMVTNRTLENLPNKSGETLSAGDVVRVYETEGGHFSQYIGLKG